MAVFKRELEQCFTLKHDFIQIQPIVGEKLAWPDACHRVAEKTNDGSVVRSVSLRIVTGLTKAPTFAHKANRGNECSNLRLVEVRKKKEKRIERKKERKKERMKKEKKEGRKKERKKERKEGNNKVDKKKETNKQTNKEKERKKERQTERKEGRKKERKEREKERDKTIKAISVLVKINFK
ncbi:hypothetical protein ACROYT_G014837 [Oculina patagonica]